MSDNKFGVNLRWLLGELANADAEQIETGEIEIYGEDEQGREGSATCDVFELVGAAVELIDEMVEREKTWPWTAVEDSLPKIVDAPVVVHFTNGSIETVNVEDWLRDEMCEFNFKITHWAEVIPPRKD